MKPLIEIKGLSRKYGEEFALRDATYSFPRKGFYAIVGASGSGKSTLLNIISGMDDGYSGYYRFGKDCFALMNEEEVTKFRSKHIGYLFQDFNLFELETCFDNLYLPIDSISDIFSSLKKRRAMDMLSFVNLEGKSNQRANLLSGGEKQRIGLARALASDPEVVLADEPSGALDAKNAEHVFKSLRKASKDRLVIAVSHDESLCRRYADVVLKMEDGVLREEGKIREIESKEGLSGISLGKKKGNPRASSLFFFKHAFHRMKAKKWRALLSELSISFGLLGLGLSSYVSTTISSQIEGAISSIVPENQIVMSPNSDGPSTLSNVYGASLERAKDCLEYFPDCIRGYGTKLLLSYEQWFVDDNKLDCINGTSRFEIPGFSCRHFDEYLWLEEYTHLTFYPRRPARMDFDEIILGLPYSTMFNLCYGLGILRNYQSLGDFINSRGLHAILTLSNHEYEFEDEELFRIIAVVPTSSPCLFHTDHFFNRHLFLDTLRFRSSLSEETLSPQYIYEIPYLCLSGNEEDFLSLVRKEESFRDLLFEKASYDYLPSLCSIGENCQIKRLFVFSADKNSISWQIMDECMEKEKKIIGRMPTANGSYYAECGSIAMGFSLPFFLCPDKESALEIIDAYSHVPIEAIGATFTLPPLAKDGGIISASSGGLRLSSLPKRGYRGELPSSMDEAMLSSSLFKKWGEPNCFHVVACINETRGEVYLEREFRTVEMKISGVVEENKEVFYVQNDWTIDFFFCRLGMSSYILEPDGVCFYFENEEDVRDSLAILAKEYPNYRFYSPSMDVSSSIDSTVGYIGQILGAFSLFSLALSFFLLSLIVSLTLSEGKQEARLLWAMGVGKEGIFRCFYFQGVIYGLLALLPSCLGLAISQFLVGRYISQSFSSSYSLSIGGLPFLTMLSSCLLFMALLALVLFMLIKKRKIESRK